ncbi:U4/U6.U5 tri-snRNP-associated protein 1 isoform 3 [Hibiscus syriacus]|uniref:U4/U6.U5 tri-snRNP-associated protein 1 isoform 3 n=1 Tax=Hibiscus syriacus TaxID=106335 RepID=A0A6A3B983_HIBSY|nr:U4/U6.U5 tri-snRNP-associated protein 1 isoform 3 [Hibiscus syriacus]
MEKDRYDREDNASRERWDGGAYSDELEQNEKHRSKNKKKSSLDEEKDHRGRDRERDRSKRSSNERKGKGKGKGERENKDREKEREGEKDRDREKGKERSKQKNREEDYEGSKDGELSLDYEESRDKDGDELNAKRNSGLVQAASSEIEERIVRMKEERLKNKSEGISEVSAWVSNSRKIEEKRNVEKEKALQLSKFFEEQDNFDQGEDEDEEADNHPTHDLAGVKVLHGLDKVLDGGAVVLTLKDQSILANEQKRRDEAYKAAKKKTGVYDDKFNDEPGSEKKYCHNMMIQSQMRFRKRLQGVPTNNRVEDLNNAAKISSDYYTQEEMLRFKKPKKKKALRKKEKLDIDALEAEAISSGLGARDLGSRNDSRRQAIKEEEARSEAEKRKNAYQAAYAKTDEASKLLRLEQTLTVKPEEDENQDDQNTYTGEVQENKVVITEMEEFVWGLQLDEEAHKPDSEDVFMDEDEVPGASEQDKKNAENEVGGWSEVADTSSADEKPANEDKDEIVPDETIHEVAVGKGLSGVLKLLKDRGTLKETIEWGGRNMDKKKSKLVGIVDEDRQNDRTANIEADALAKAGIG